MTRNITKRSKRDKPESSPSREPRKKDQGITIALISQITLVIVAVVGCISAVSVALLDSPLVPRLFPLTSTQAAVSETPAFTQSPPALATDTPFFTATFMSTEPPSTLAEPLVTSTSMPTAEPVASMLVAILTASLTEGKSPLPVNFNARESYIQFADGSVAVCGSAGFCTFTWAIYRNQRQVVAPFKGQGTFSYTFSGKGEYSVTVYVCRATVCADDGVVVTVK